MITFIYLGITLVLFLISGCFGKHKESVFPRLLLSILASCIITSVIGIIIVYSSPYKIIESTEFEEAYLKGGKLKSDYHSIEVVDSIVSQDTITGIERTVIKKEVTGVGSLWDFSQDVSITYKCYMTDEVYRSWKASMEKRN